MRNVIFLGQKRLGENCFELLLNSQDEDFKVLGVVSNKSEDVWWGSNKIYNKTLDSGIDFFDNRKPNEEEILDFIIKKDINTIISVQHSWILSEKLLNSVSGYAFNLHNAKLPDYKGNNIFSHVIINGEKYHTSTIHFMSKEVDMGDIIIENTIKVDISDTSKTLYEKANLNAEKTFKEFLKSLKSKKAFHRIPIKKSGTFYKRNSIEALKEIQNINDYQEVDRKSRAFYFDPFEPAYYIVGGKKFYVLPDSYFNS